MEQLAAFSGEVHQFVAHRVSNLADAEDIAQQTFLVALEKHGTFRNGNLRAWLFMIARHLIVDYLRAKNRFASLDVETPGLVEAEPMLKTGGDLVLEVCEHRAMLQCYLNCISRRLEMSEEVAVLLAVFYGYRDKDSAETLAMSLPSFKLLLHKARVHLHEAGQGRCALMSADGPAHCSACAGRMRADTAECLRDEPRRHSPKIGLGLCQLCQLRDRLRCGLKDAVEARHEPSLANG